MNIQEMWQKNKPTFNAPYLRIVKIGLVDFWRNRWLSLAATIMMTLTIFTIALFVLLNYSINETAKTLQNKIDVAVFFKDAATEAQITDLQNALKTRSDVKDVVYISRDEALTRFKEQSKYRATILQLLDQGYGANLPRSISVTANDPQNLSDIATYIQQPPYDVLIDRISYQENKNLIDKYISSMSFVKKIGLGLSAIFTLIAVLVIYNTILLMIFSRKDEIEIMQLVGATSWYIKFPFVMEGMIYGLLATIITTAILMSSAKAVAPFVTSYIASPSFDFLQFFFFHLPLITLIELFMGVVIGGFCSYFAVKSHLK